MNLREKKKGQTEVWVMEDERCMQETEGVRKGIVVGGGRGGHRAT
jgi:hypothetical protein